MISQSSRHETISGKALYVSTIWYRVSEMSLRPVVQGSIPEEAVSTWRICALANDSFGSGKNQQLDPRIRWLPKKSLPHSGFDAGLQRSSKSLRPGSCIDDGIELPTSTRLDSITYSVWQQNIILWSWVAKVSEYESSFSLLATLIVYPSHQWMSLLCNTCSTS